MLFSDHYFTIATAVEGFFKDKGSKFLAYAFPIANEKDAKEHLENIKKLHPKATHHCFAYRLGLDGNNFRINDDGEPSGTAGRPILGQLDSKGITNALVVVVRYYGGTNLGIPGLINAYKTATAEALQQSTILEKRLHVHYELRFGYELMSDVMNAIKRSNVLVLKQNFTDISTLEIAIPLHDAEATLLKIKSWIAKIPLEMATNELKIEGLVLTYLFTR